MLYYRTVESKLGPIYIVADENYIVKVLLDEEQWNEYQVSQDQLTFASTPILEKAATQFEEYFSGKRQVFELPLYQSGTDFQRKVWKALQGIPYGETISYLDVAQLINHPKAVRAVGQANRKNNLPIIVPCHRVVGKNNSLTGYAGKKIDLKEKLLQLEGILI